MASEGVANFQAIMVSVAAVIGAGVAGFGLWTWKQQIRWQQGRGLATNLLQAFFVLRQVFDETRRHDYFRFDDTLSAEDKLSAANAAFTRAKEHDDKLNAALTTFQRYVAEAIVVWNEDFAEVMSELSDLKHIGSSLMFTGAGSMDPSRSKMDREGTMALHSAFKDDFYGSSADRRGVSGRLSELQVKVKAKIDQQRLN